MLRKSLISTRQRKIPGKGRLDLKLTYCLFLLPATPTLPSPCLLFLSFSCAGTHLNHSLKRQMRNEMLDFVRRPLLENLRSWLPQNIYSLSFVSTLILDKSDWTHRMVSFLPGTYRSNWDLKRRTLHRSRFACFNKSVGISHVFINNAPAFQSQSHCKY